MSKQRKTSEEKIREALTAKNWDIEYYHWEHVQYYGEGREGGYDISIEIETYNDVSDEVIDKYYSVFDEVGRQLLERSKETNGKHISECGAGYIMAYNLPDVMYVINLLPDRLTIK